MNDFTGEMPDFEAAGKRATEQMYELLDGEQRRADFLGRIAVVQQRYDAEYVPFLREIWGEATDKLLVTPIQYARTVEYKVTYAQYSHWYVSHQATEPLAFRLKTVGPAPKVNPPAAIFGARSALKYHRAAIANATTLALESYTISPQPSSRYENIQNKHGDYLSLVHDAHKIINTPEYAPFNPVKTATDAIVHKRQMAAYDGLSALRKKRKKSDDIEDNLVQEICLELETRDNSIDLTKLSHAQVELGVRKAAVELDDRTTVLEAFTTLFNLIRYAEPEPVDYIRHER